MAESLTTLDMNTEVIETLGEAQIRSVQELLDATATPQQREDLAKQIGVSAEQVQTWANRANLLQIPEVGPQAARLLVACGISSPSELQHWQERDLYAKLQEVNGRQHLLAELPSQHVVGVWIRDAAILARYAHSKGQVDQASQPMRDTAPRA